MDKAFFSLISGIKMSCTAINIGYPLHAEVNLIVFLPNQVILFMKSYQQITFVCMHIFVHEVQYSEP